jgi:hypothetical protein
VLLRNVAGYERACSARKRTGFQPV